MLAESLSSYERNRQDHLGLPPLSVSLLNFRTGLGPQAYPRAESVDFDGKLTLRLGGLLEEYGMLDTHGRLTETECASNDYVPSSLSGSQIDGGFYRYAFAKSSPEDLASRCGTNTEDTNSDRPHVGVDLGTLFRDHCNIIINHVDRRMLQQEDAIKQILSVVLDPLVQKGPILAASPLECAPATVIDQIGISTLSSTARTDAKARTNISGRTFDAEDNETTPRATVIEPTCVKGCLASHERQIIAAETLASQSTSTLGQNCEPQHWLHFEETASTLPTGSTSKAVQVSFDVRSIEYIESLPSPMKMGPSLEQPLLSEPLLGGVARQPCFLSPDRGRVENAYDSAALGEGVTMELKKEGFFQAVVKMDCFETLSLLAIVLNTVWIGIDTDYNKADVLCEAPLIFQLATHSFCIFFVVELIIRCFAFERPGSALRHKGFLFDLFLVASNVWEAWVQNIIFIVFDTGRGNFTSLYVFRILRILRLARVWKLANSFPPFVVIANGLVKVLHSVVATICFLLLMIYVFALLFTQLLADHEVGSGIFETVPMSMQFLLLQVVCGPSKKVMISLQLAGFQYYLLFLSFVFFGSISLMNTLIGLVCDTIFTVSEEEVEKRESADLERALHHFTSSVQMDASGAIPKHVILDLANDEETRRHFAHIGVEVEGFSKVARLFIPDTGVHIDDLKKVILLCRSKKSASAKDVLDIILLDHVKHSIAHQRRRVSGIFSATTQDF